MRVPVPERSKQRVAIALLVAATAVAAGCATNPVTGEKEFSLMSEGQEIQAGRELDPEVRKQMGVYDDPAIQEYVQSIGLRMARSSERPNLPWTFTVVDGPAINAFALPGGYIYITRGILAYLEDEAELAGVLGHEIGHVTARHSAQAYTRATGTGIGLAIASIFVPAARPFQGLAETALGVLFLKHGRDDELQADRLGVRYEFTGGWEPAGVPDMLNTLARLEETADRRGVPNWLATHPDPASRVEEIAPAVKELEAKATAPLAVGHDEYLRRIDGLVYGDSPEQGIVRGDLFLHPPLRFSMKFPSGWEVNNSETQVVAKEPGNDVYMMLQLVEQPRGRNIEEVAVDAMRQAGFVRLQGGRTAINGLEAHIGLYEGSMDGLGRVTTRAAHISHSRQIYIVAGIAKREVFERYDRAFADSIQSFRALSREEADSIRPNRIDLYVVRSGDTWQSVAERVSRGIVKSSTLAIMNASPVNQQPEPGRRIKVPVPG